MVGVRSDAGRADRPQTGVRNAILDKNVVVREEGQVGVDLEHDRELFTVSAAGIVAVAKSTVI